MRDPGVVPKVSKATGGCELSMESRAVLGNASHAHMAVPVLGLGCWRVSKEECTAVVKAALQHGYRHIDDAAACESMSVSPARIR